MKEKIRNQVLALGADLCGFAHVDRFSDAPIGFSPTDIWAGCRSVISIAVALPKGLFEVEPRLIYGRYNGLSCDVMDELALRTAKYVERTYRCKAVPMPCDSPYEYWDAGNMEGRGLVSMKHIAVCAGLGAIGQNGLFMCEAHGNMVTLGCVLCDLELTSDARAAALCVEGCELCAAACPVGAISEGRVNQKLCRQHTYGRTARGFDTVDCNLCRAVCPLN